MELHNAEAEQSLIGSCLLSEQSRDQALDEITPDMFFRKDHQAIFGAIARMTERGDAVDVVTVCDELGDELDTVGGMAYVGSLAANVPSRTNAKSYAKIVRDYHVRRSVYAAANEVMLKAFDRNNDISALLDDAQTKMLSVSTSGRSGGPELIKPILSDVIDQIDKMQQAGTGMVGIPTGFSDIDKKLSGLAAGDLVILAGRPSMGKTTLAMNIAENVAMHDNGVLVFSLEMPKAQLARKIISSLGPVDYQNLRTGSITDEQWPMVMHGVDRIADKNLHIDDQGGLTVAEIRSRARKTMREHGLKLVVIDYLQLIQASGGENQNIRISRISAGLKNLAKELDVPVVALSQLNRSLEQRPNKRPVMADLRESGAIEQDADVIIFIYRDEVYNKESEQKGMAEIIIAKQRNGPTGVIPLLADLKNSRFTGYAGEYENEWSD